MRTFAQAALNQLEVVAPTERWWAVGHDLHDGARCRFVRATSGPDAIRLVDPDPYSTLLATEADAEWFVENAQRLFVRGGERVPFEGDVELAAGQGGSAPPTLAALLESGRPRRRGVRKGLLALVALVASLGSCNSNATAAAGPDCASCAWAYEVCVDLARTETIAEIAARAPGAMDRYRERRLACTRSYKACVGTCEPRRIACGRRAR